jgi:hypothetical protein
VHNAPHLTEPLCTQFVGHLNIFVLLPDDLESETSGCELNESQAGVTGIGIMVVGFDVADTTIIVLELTLNDEIVLGAR